MRASAVAGSRGATRQVACRVVRGSARGLASHGRSAGARSARDMAASAAAGRASGDAPYKALVGTQVFRATDGAPVALTDQWGAGERALVAWTRSLGCPFCQELAIQMRRDVQPQLDTLGVKMLMVSIGTPERSKDFVARTGFPAERLFVDPDNKTYDALGLTNDLGNTFFNPATPLSLLKRATEGKTEDLANVLSGWQPWMTPNGPQQAMNQGGMFLFEGDKVLFSYYDKATADHADLGEVLLIARKLGDANANCDCQPDSAGTPAPSPTSSL